MTEQTKPAPSTSSGQAKPEINEVATVQKDITYPAYAGVLRETDDTLLTRGQGKGLKLYDELERDCTVYGDLQKRKLAIISRPWQVDPASDAPLDKKAADIVRRQLASEALNFDNVCLKLLPAILKGFAVGEVMWGYDGKEIVVTDIRPRDQRRFGFGDDYALRLKTLSNLLPGEELPERKFIVHSFGSDTGNPYGLGLGTRLFWPAFFKRKGITFWLTFVDKFASPTPVGKYPPGTSVPDQTKLLNALDALSQSAGVTIPEGMIIELLEAARSGEAGYEKLCRYMDEQITHTILGESPSVRGGGGQAASAAITRNEVRLELVKADSDLLSATLNRTLVKWITEYNVPGATPPRVWRKVEEQKDLGAVAERDAKICGMGFRPSLAYINETYGGEWEVAAPPVNTKAGSSVPKPPGDAANFLESIYFYDSSQPRAEAGGSDGGQWVSAGPTEAEIKHIFDNVDAGRPAINMREGWRIGKSGDKYSWTAIGKGSFPSEYLTKAQIIEKLNMSPASYAEGAQSSVLSPQSSLADQLATESAAAWAAVMAHVTDLVDHAESMEALQASLLQAYDGLPLADLRRVMAQGFQVAALAGMADAT